MFLERSHAAAFLVHGVLDIESDGIDWLPLPDLDSIPPFAALLDADAGGFVALAPTTPHRVTRRYLPHTAVLETTFTTNEGVVRVTDALNTGLAGRLPWCELARRIDGVAATLTLRAVMAPGAAPWRADKLWHRHALAPTSTLQSASWTIPYLVCVSRMRPT